MIEIPGPVQVCATPPDGPTSGAGGLVRWSPSSPAETKRSSSKLLRRLGLLPEGDGLRSVESVTGGTTNQILLCTTDSGRQMLVRLFGEAASDFIDRRREMLFFEAVAHRGLGPRLLGTFANGRVEEYIPAPPLTAAQLRSPSISRAIARKVKEFHCLRDVPGLECSQAILFPQLRSWHRLAVAACGKEEHGGYNIERLGQEVDKLERRLSSVHSPLVPSHNDVNHLNILLKPDGDIMLIDLEYASCNHRGFDLGNHFCEWATDFQTSTPHKMDFSQWPSEQQQRAFCREYLEHEPSGGRRREVSEAEVEGLRHEAVEFSLASHLQWGIWALVQSRRSTIDFDFIFYARQRLEQYFMRMAA